MIPTLAANVTADPGFFSVAVEKLPLFLILAAWWAVAWVLVYVPTEDPVEDEEP